MLPCWFQAYVVPHRAHDSSVFVRACVRSHVLVLNILAMIRSDTVPVSHGPKYRKSSYICPVTGPVTRWSRGLTLRGGEIRIRFDVLRTLRFGVWGSWLVCCGAYLCRVRVCRRVVGVCVSRGHARGLGGEGSPGRCSSTLAGMKISTSAATVAASERAPADATAAPLPLAKTSVGAATVALAALRAGQPALCCIICIRSSGGLAP